MRVKNVILDTIFPEDIYCISCTKPIKLGRDKKNGFSLCPECSRRMLDERFPSCRLCGRILDDDVEQICEECYRRKPEYEQGIAAVSYEKGGKKVIHDLKYGGKKYLSKNIAKIMKYTLKDVGKYDIIIPVPMHPDKKKLRGFCQTGLICHELAKLTNCPVSVDNLVRVRKTEAMSGLSSEQRRKNIKAAFSLENPEEIRNKKILLVDDLLTTGSTARECTRILKAAGAAEVYLAVFAAASLENHDS